MTSPVTSVDQLSDDDGPAFKRRIGDETVVETVLSAVSAVTDASASGTPAELTGDGEGSEPLPPLYDAIDPDALSKLFSESVAPDALSKLFSESVEDDVVSNSVRDDVEVTFPYAGCSVTVTGSDTVLVREHPPRTE